MMKPTDVPQKGCPQVPPDTKKYTHNRQRLGKGGFGEVFLACETAELHKKNPTLYALKINEYNFNNEVSKVTVPALKRGLDLLSSLNNENIIQLIEYCENINGNIFYLIFEYCDGGSLQSILDSSPLSVETEDKRKLKYLSEPEVVGYMLQIVNGFKALHNKDRNINHRDIKPENIMLKNGVLKIIDFDFAKVDDLKNTTDYGTPGYASPEVVFYEENDKDVSFEKCDIWSFGIMIFMLLSGRFPWKVNYGGPALKIKFIEEAKKKPLEFPNEPEISKEMRELLKGMIVVDYRQRWGWKEVFDKIRYFEKRQILELKIQEEEMKDSNEIEKWRSLRSFFARLGFLMSLAHVKGALRLDKFQNAYKMIGFWEYDINHQIQKLITNLLNRQVLDNKLREKCTKWQKEGKRYQDFKGKKEKFNFFQLKGEVEKILSSKAFTWEGENDDFNELRKMLLKINEKKEVEELLSLKKD